MSKNSKAKKAKKAKPLPVEDGISDIVKEQQRRQKLQSQGLPSQQRPDNDAPVISNGEREALHMRAQQQGFYNLPADMLPRDNKDED
jgi:hypothetical protein